MEARAVMRTASGSRRVSGDEDLSGNASVSLSLLSGFQLLRGALPVHIPLNAQRLVAFLALKERALLRSYVAGCLWPDKTEGRAAANVRSALWRLRQAGLAGVLESRGGHLRCAVENIDVRHAVLKARELISSAAPTAECHLDSELLRGDLLPDWYDDWVTLERERLRQLRLHALEALCFRLIERNELAHAIDVAFTAIAVEPLRETAHRALILAYLAEGNHREAVRQYRFYEVLVQNELGIPPSPQMDELVRPIRVAIGS